MKTALMLGITLGMLKQKLGNLDFAKLFLNQAYKLNNRHLESLS